jgi:hypothetical protein
MKKILLFFIAGLYLFLSTGVTLLQTHCLCSDSTRISLYADSESCMEAVAGQDCCEQDSQCSDNQTDHEHPFCGCEEPIVTYLKLSNHLGDGSALEYPTGKLICLDHLPKEKLLQKIVFLPEPIKYSEYSPPENERYGRVLITFLSQRKIALAA